MNRTHQFAQGLASVTVVVILWLINCHAQSTTKPVSKDTGSTSATVPQSTEKTAGLTAYPADVASVDAIIRRIYDGISGPAGKKRDWERERALYLPGARLIAVGKRRTGEVVNRVMEIEGYISANSEAMEKEGFFETEIARRTEEFGNIVHVWSTYEARHKADDSKPFMRGINSIQLINDGKRWWVITIMWQAENPDSPLPEKYLK